MAKAKRGTSTDRVPLREVYLRLVETYGSPQLAEEQLRERLNADRGSWDYLRKTGDAPDRELWKSARVNFGECSARTGYTMFFAGTDNRDDLRSTEWLGIRVSRAHVAALLPGESTECDATGYQGRVWDALDQLRDEGKQLRDCTQPQLRSLVGKRIEQP